MIKLLRTPKAIKSYEKRLKDVKDGTYVFDLLKLKSLDSWMYWVLMENEFPYDKIASKHNLLIPKRFIADGKELEEEELYELYQIKDELGDDYDVYMESAKHNRTVENHFHIHCIEYIK